MDWFHYTKILIDYIPNIVIDNFKGKYLISESLEIAYPSATKGDYAYVENSLSYWLWNDKTTPASWVNQNINVSNYLLLPCSARNAVVYKIIQ